MQTSNTKSNITQIIEACFLKKEVGEVVTYDEIRAALGGKKFKIQWCSVVAYKYMPRDYRRAFDCIRGVGYERLSDDKTVRVFSGKLATRTTSVVKTTTRSVSTVERQKLNELARIEYDIFKTVSNSLANTVVPIKKMQAKSYSVGFVKGVS